jgi:hypothetical protein
MCKNDFGAAGGVDISDKFCYREQEGSKHGGGDWQTTLRQQKLLALPPVMAGARALKIESRVESSITRWPPFFRPGSSPAAPITHAESYFVSE